MPQTRGIRAPLYVSTLVVGDTENIVYAINPRIDRGQCGFLHFYRIRSRVGSWCIVSGLADVIIGVVQSDVVQSKRELE